MTSNFPPPDPQTDANRGLTEAERTVMRMERTISWRVTSPLRMLGGAVRRIRKNAGRTPPVQRTGPVAVVIPCHDYGRYLPEALDSLFTQNVKPSEIIVVDDASTDDTADVARRYAASGVRYLRGEWRDVAQARNAGAALTVQPLIMFLDADDYLPPHYIARCAEAMSDPRVGIAYGEMQHVGDSTIRYKSHEFSNARLQIRNYISSHALMRREAFDLVGGYRSSDGGYDDWDIYRRIANAGWAGRKADTFVYYRVHGGSRLDRMNRDPGMAYWRTAYLMESPVTVHTVFTGDRALIAPYMRALEEGGVDPSLLHLHCMDISGDESFGSELRLALASCPFDHVTYARESAGGRTGIALELFVNSHLRAACTTEYALLLGENLHMQAGSLRAMLQTFTEGTVAVVAHYPRTGGGSAVWKKNDAGLPVYCASRGCGIEQVGGGGLGCTLLHMSALREIPLSAGTENHPSASYGETAFLRLRKRGNILCNWDIGVTRRS